MKWYGNFLMSVALFSGVQISCADKAAVDASEKDDHAVVTVTEDKAPAKPVVVAETPKVVVDAPKVVVAEASKVETPKVVVDAPKDDSKKAVAAAEPRASAGWTPVYSTNRTLLEKVYKQVPLAVITEAVAARNKLNTLVAEVADQFLAATGDKDALSSQKAALELFTTMLRKNENLLWLTTGSVTRIAEVAAKGTSSTDVTVRDSSLVLLTDMITRFKVGVSQAVALGLLSAKTADEFNAAAATTQQRTLKLFKALVQKEEAFDHARKAASLAVENTVVPFQPRLEETKLDALDVLIALTHRDKRADARVAIQAVHDKVKAIKGLSAAVAKKLDNLGKALAAEKKTAKEPAKASKKPVLLKLLKAAKVAASTKASADKKATPPAVKL